MYLLILLINIISVNASNTREYCEQQYDDGIDIDICMGNVDKGLIGDCEKSTNTGPEFNKCIEQRRKKQADVIANNPKQRSNYEEKCEPQTAIKNCEEHAVRSTKLRNNPEIAKGIVESAIQRCIRFCSPSSGETSGYLKACTTQGKNIDADKANLLSLQEQCGMYSGGVSKPDDKDASAEKTKLDEAAKEAGLDPATAFKDSNYANGYCYNKTGGGGDYKSASCFRVEENGGVTEYVKFIPTIDDKTASTVKDMTDGSIHPSLVTTSSDAYSSQQCAGITGGSYCKSTSRDGSTGYYFKGQDGQLYNTYDEMAFSQAQSRYRPPVPEGWSPPPPTTNNGGASAGTGTRPAPVVSRDTGGGGGSGATSSSSARDTGSAPAPVAQTNGGATNGAAAGGSGSAGSSTGGATQTAGGAASGGSGMSNSNAFSNPYANTSLTANKPTDRQSFAALSNKDTSSYRDESVGADSGGSQSYDGGGFNQRNNGGFRGGSSEGVNREAPVGRSSLGSGGSVAVAASNGARDSSMKAKLEELGGSTFQSGFHKANGKEPLSPSSLSKTKSQLAKMNKAKRKKIMDQCKGDMSCIASILGVTKSRRGAGGRGLASLPAQSLPQGVWSGHTDILSHMAKVHDKMPINYDGEID